MVTKPLWLLIGAITFIGKSRSSGCRCTNYPSINPIPAPDALSKFENLDSGFLFKFVDVTLVSGEVITGEVVSVINERPFMWNPEERDTLSIIRIGDPNAGPASFDYGHESVNAIFSVNTDEIASIIIVALPVGQITYANYMRSQRITVHSQPMQDEMWCSTGFQSYHAWEDGRSNYAWDFGTVDGDTLLSYQYPATRNDQFYVWGKEVYLPFDGVVATANGSHPDNAPDITAAVEIEDEEDGSTVDLEELPSNGVEVSPGGPFLLRLLHFRQNSVPAGVEVGGFYAAGTLVGQVGNSGTTYVPHLHLAFGFLDQNGRYWSLPIEWEDYRYRNLLPYSTGYEFGPYHDKAYGWPEVNHHLTIP